MVGIFFRYATRRERGLTRNLDAGPLKLFDNCITNELRPVGITGRAQAPVHAVDKILTGGKCQQFLTFGSLICHWVYR